MDRVPDGIVKDLNEPKAGSEYKQSGVRASNEQGEPSPKQLSDNVHSLDIKMTAPLKPQSPDNFNSWKK